MTTFLVIWAGQLVSTLGSALATFAIGVWVYETTGSTTRFSVTLLASSLASVGLAPLAGAIADRWDRRTVMIVSDTGAALTSVFVLAMLLTGRLQVWHIYLTAFANAAFSTFQRPAYAASTSLLVPKQHLARAGGMAQIGNAVGQLVAPALAGALYVAVGLRSILMVDIVTYVVALTTLVVVRIPKPATMEETEDQDRSLWQDVIFGWRYLRRRAGLRGLLLTYTALNFFLVISLALYAPRILEITTPDVLGYVNLVGSVGMVAGTLLMSAWGGPRRRILGIYAGETMIGLTTLLFGLSVPLPVLALSRFFCLVAMPISGACHQAILQSKVSPKVQGRVFSTQGMIIDAGVPLAYLVAGPLAERVVAPAMAQGGSLARWAEPLVGTGPGRSMGLIFIAAGLLNTLISLVVLLNPRIRRVEIELPDAVA